ncbi:MAG: T9SS type A sorting domain-containing protein [candidate division Zixibacteria bacterium]|nr:T9SS type A sorting domain-containing protein [candidate division Zixibacteria bacterium]
MPYAWIDGFVRASYEYNNWENLMLDRYEVDAPLEIQLNGWFSDTEREGNLDLSITAHEPITQTGLRVRIALTEDSLYYEAPNGTNWHNNTMRDIIPDTLGIFLEISQGQTVELSQPFECPEPLVIEQCELVAWVQADYSDLEILQTAKVSLTDLAQCVCDVGMIPDEDPVIVPRGGNFGVTGTISNPCDEFMTTDVWYGVHAMDEFFELGNINNIPINPGQFLQGHFYQHVSIHAPTGEFEYMAYCGDSPDVKNDSFSFMVTVTNNRISGGAEEWHTEGSFLNQTVLPEETGSLEVYPNPFNAFSTINFDLKEATSLKLDIYNIAGRKVVTLADGEFERGEYSLSWDASEYPSGVYFIKLAAGNYITTKRMTLLK